jgi:hypothetical protein
VKGSCDIVLYQARRRAALGDEVNDMEEERVQRAWEDRWRSLPRTITRQGSVGVARLTRPPPFALILP